MEAKGNQVGVPLLHAGGRRRARGAPRLLDADGATAARARRRRATAACAHPPRRLGAGGGVVRALLLAARGGETREFCD